MRELTVNEVEMVDGGAMRGDPCTMSGRDFTLLVGLSVITGLTAAFSGGLATAGMFLAFGSHINSVLDKDQACRTAVLK